MSRGPSRADSRRREVDVLTAQDDGIAEDPALLDRATALGRILFSQDEDLFVEAVPRQRIGQQFATVVFARQLELSIGRCIADLEALAKVATPDDAQGQIIFR